MAKTCPSCNAELAAPAKKTSAWLALMTALGVSAAAVFVFNHVRKAQDGHHIIEDALNTCARAASALDERLGEAAMRLAS